MSDFDRIAPLLQQVGDDCPPAPRHRAWAELTFRASRRPVISVFGACPDEFQEQHSSTLDVQHINSETGLWAHIAVVAGPAEDIFTLLDRALDFVRTETPVPL